MGTQFARLEGRERVHAARTPSIMDRIVVDQSYQRSATRYGMENASRYPDTHEAVRASQQKMEDGRSIGGFFGRLFSGRLRESVRLQHNDRLLARNTSPDGFSREHMQSLEQMRQYVTTVTGKDAATLDPTTRYAAARTATQEKLLPFHNSADTVSRAQMAEEVLAATARVDPAHSDTQRAEHRKATSDSMREMRAKIAQDIEAEADTRRFGAILGEDIGERSDFFRANQEAVGLKTLESRTPTRASLVQLTMLANGATIDDLISDTPQARAMEEVAALKVVNMIRTGDTGGLAEVFTTAAEKLAATPLPTTDHHNPTSVNVDLRRNTLVARLCVDCDQISTNLHKGITLPDGTPAGFSPEQKARYDTAMPYMQNLSEFSKNFIVMGKFYASDYYRRDSIDDPEIGNTMFTMAYLDASRDEFAGRVPTDCPEFADMGFLQLRNANIQADQYASIMGGGSREAANKRAFMDARSAEILAEHPIEKRGRPGVIIEGVNDPATLRTVTPQITEIQEKMAARTAGRTGASAEREPVSLSSLHAAERSTSPDKARPTPALTKAHTPEAASRDKGASK
jgi:hypothetical protein